MVTNDTLLYALIVCVILFLFITLIFTYLVLMSIRQIHREKVINNYIEDNKDVWYRYLVLNEEIMLLSNSHTLNETIKEAIDRIFINYVTTTNNEIVIQRISHFANLNLQKYYRNMLYHKNWGVRMNGLYRTLEFRLYSLVPDIEHLLKKDKVTSKEEYLLMLRILSVYNRNLFLAHFYKPVYPFKEFEYKTLLSYLDNGYIDIFVKSFDTLSLHLRISLLDYLSLNSKMDTSYITFYENLLSHHEKEIRIRVLKTISHLGTISSVDLYKSFAYSPHWEERLMLAKLIIHAEEDDAKPILEKLLYDETWLIRKQAAISLRNVRYGEAILKQIAEQQEDRYAAEMAKEILQVR